jgi:RNA polymerase-binding transcription factor DksA
LESFFSSQLYLGGKKVDLWTRAQVTSKINYVDIKGAHLRPFLIKLDRVNIYPYTNFTLKILKLPMSYYSPQFFEERKKDLEERKDKILNQLKSFTNADPHKFNNFNADFPNYGDDEDENAAEVATFEGNLYLEETLETSLEMINRALKKIEDGTYGLCEKCHSYISEGRLIAMPTATRCANGNCKKAK